MVIQLSSLSNHIVCHIIRKMEPLSFKNACLSSKYMVDISNLYKKSIRFFMEDYQLELSRPFEEDQIAKGSNILVITISKPDDESCKDYYRYYCKPEDLMTTRSELAFFIIETVRLNHPLMSTILEELQKAKVYGYRVYIEDLRLVNPMIRILRPTVLVFDCKDRVPSEIIEDELLTTMEGLCMYVDQEEQARNCIKVILPRMPVYSLIAQDSTFIRIEFILDDIKNVFQKMLNGSNSIINVHFDLCTNIPSSTKLIELIRPFQEMSHTLLKRFGVTTYSSKYNYVVFLFRLPNGSTLACLLQERTSLDEKQFDIAYEVIGDLDQFLNFFARSRHVELEKAIEELSNGKRKKRQFDKVKQEYFSNK